MLTSDIQDLILSDFQLLLAPAMSRWEISAPVNFNPMLHKRRLVVKEPLINLYHRAVTFGGASKYLDVPGALYSLWLGTFTVAILMGTVQAQNRKVISILSTLSLKMIQNGGFQFCPEKCSKSFNHGDDWGSMTWEPTSSGGTFDQSGLFLCQIWTFLEADGSGPRTKALQCLWCFKVGNTKRKPKKNINIIRYLDRKVWYLDLWCAVFNSSSWILKYPMTPWHHQAAFSTTMFSNWSCSPTWWDGCQKWRLRHVKIKQCSYLQSLKMVDVCIRNTHNITPGTQVSDARSLNSTQIHHPNILSKWKKGWTLILKDAAGEF